MSADYKEILEGSVLDSKTIQEQLLSFIEYTAMTKQTLKSIIKDENEYQAILHLLDSKKTKYNPPTEISPGTELNKEYFKSTEVPPLYTVAELVEKIGLNSHQKKYLGLIPSDNSPSFETKKFGQARISPYIAPATTPAFHPHFKLS